MVLGLDETFAQGGLQRGAPASGSAAQGGNKTGPSARTARHGDLDDQGLQEVNESIDELHARLPRLDMKLGEGESDAPALQVAVQGLTELGRLVGDLQGAAYCM